MNHDTEQPSPEELRYNAECLAAIEYDEVVTDQAINSGLSAEDATRLLHDHPAAHVIRYLVGCLEEERAARTSAGAGREIATEVFCYSAAVKYISQRLRDKPTVTNLGNAITACLQAGEIEVFVVGVGNCVIIASPLHWTHQNVQDDFSGHFSRLCKLNPDRVGSFLRAYGEAILATWIAWDRSVFENAANCKTFTLAS